MQTEGGQTTFQRPSISGMPEAEGGNGTDRSFSNRFGNTMLKGAEGSVAASMDITSKFRNFQPP